MRPIIKTSSQHTDTVSRCAGAIARAVETPDRLAQPTERRAATTKPDYTTMPGITSPAGLLPGGEREQPATGSSPHSHPSRVTSLFMSRIECVASPMTTQQNPSVLGPLSVTNS